MLSSMNDGDFEVDILDKAGQVVGKKLRKDIVKGQDIYHAVYCVLVTPEGNIAISKIAARQDMPNLHAGSYGCTAATIKRTGESGDEAMARALQNELHINVVPELISEEVIEVDNTFRKIGLYKVISEVPQNFSKQDIDEIVVLSREEFAQLTAEQPGRVTPLLKLFWDNYTS